METYNDKYVVVECDAQVVVEICSGKYVAVKCGGQEVEEICNDKWAAVEICNGKCGVVEYGE